MIDGGLPFDPEPLDQLTERFPRAVETVEDFSRRVIDRSPRHVFDTKAGIRLYVHRPFDDVTLVTAKYYPGTPLGAAYCSGMLSFDHFAAAAMSRYRWISGDQRPVEGVEASPAEGAVTWAILPEGYTLRDAGEAGRLIVPPPEGE